MGSTMQRISFSQMIRNLSYDFYNRTITAAEYRARRKKILDDIDAEYNGHSSDDEDLTTFRMEKPDRHVEPETDTEKNYFRPSRTNETE